MKKSRYFAELSQSYDAEIDDLLTDSEGKSALQKRLQDKRREFDAILPMIEFSPEMVAVAFYGAFQFKSSALWQQLVLSQPGHADYLMWDTLKDQLTMTDWAAPLVNAALKQSGGDAFLVTTAALEFLRLKGTASAPAPEPEKERKERGDHDEDDNDDGDMDDLAEAGADWLAEQGFESPER